MKAEKPCTRQYYEKRELLKLNNQQFKFSCMHEKLMKRVLAFKKIHEACR